MSPFDDMPGSTFDKARRERAIVEDRRKQAEFFKHINWSADLKILEDKKLAINCDPGVATFNGIRSFNYVLSESGPTQYIRR